VSLRTYVANVTGFVLWVVYGVLLGSWPVAASNAVNLILAGAILALRRRYGEGGRDV
jgi:MtN3 and saliva related transmembrane protein